MNILDKIVSHKRREVEHSKNKYSIKDLSKKDLYNRECFSLSQKLNQNNNLGIIAEHKRQSPSKGKIYNADLTLKEIIIGYENAKASAISVLTDKHFFGAEENDILKARAYTNLPILRKEFIIDIFQIHETKSMGADLILLIGAILDKNQSKIFTDLAHDLGLEVIYEIHDEDEIEKIPCNIDIIGINNRDLKKFEVDFDRSLRMVEQLPKDKLKIAESGISNPNTVVDLFGKGFNGFLIGETFMKTDNPGESCLRFYNECLGQLMSND